MRPAARAALELALGQRVSSTRSLTGGDVNLAYRVFLADGTDVFVKLREPAPPDFFVREAEGLAWLAKAASLRVPEVRCVSPREGPAFLVLEYLEPGPRRRDFDERLGRGLAALHRKSPGTFGLQEDNFIGRLPQENRSCPSWGEFYRERRLLPQFERARRGGWISRRSERLFDRVASRVERWVGDAEPPARLHGDLWSGNVLVDAQGSPALIDPAVHGGHREMDLAMMRLFGGFSARVFDSYAEEYPLSPGAADRVALCQLYPALVHVNHFGGVYVGLLEQLLERVAADASPRS